MRDSSNFHRADEEAFWTSAEIQKKYRKTLVQLLTCCTKKTRQNTKKPLHPKCTLMDKSVLQHRCTHWQPHDCGFGYSLPLLAPLSLCSLSLYSQKHTRITNQISADINKGHKM